MIVAIIISLLLVGAIGFFLAKKRTLLVVLCFVLFIPSAYISSILISWSFIPSHVIACANDSSLSKCTTFSADMNYDSGDGLFTVKSLQLSNGTKATFSSCEITYSAFYKECTDAQNNKWTLSPYWK